MDTEPKKQEPEIVPPAPMVEPARNVPEIPPDKDTPEKRSPVQAKAGLMQAKNQTIGNGDSCGTNFDSRDLDLLLGSVVAAVVLW